MVTDRTGFVLMVAVLLAAVPATAGAELYRTLMKQGNRYFRNELYRDAAENYQAAVKKHQALEPYFNSGTAFFKNGRYQRAIESFNSALSFTEKPEELADIHYNLGNSFVMLKSYQEAVFHYMEGLKQDPGDLNMKYNLELALRNIRRRERERESGREGGEEEGGETPEESGGGQEPDLREEVPEGGKEPSETPEQGKKLSPREAATLINTVNNEQADVVSEIIRRRIGASDEETGW